MNFSEKLQKLRNSKNLSQEELAEIIHVSRQSVSKWELGQSFPELLKLIDISNYFNVSVDSLIKDEKELSHKDELERKENKPDNSLFNSKARRMIIGSLAGICISICLRTLLRVDQIGSRYQAVMTVIYCIVGIAISALGILKLRKYKKKS